MLENREREREESTIMFQFEQIAIVRNLPDIKKCNLKTLNASTQKNNASNLLARVEIKLCKRTTLID